MDGEIKVTAEAGRQEQGWRLPWWSDPVLPLSPGPPGPAPQPAGTSHSPAMQLSPTLMFTHLSETPPRRCLRWAHRHLCGCWSQGPSQGEVPRTENTTACPQHTAAATGHIRGAIALSLAPF